MTLPLSYYLISTYGFVGGAMAESINGWIMFSTTMSKCTSDHSFACVIAAHFLRDCLQLTVLMQWKGYHKKCWHGWSMRAFDDWGPSANTSNPENLQSHFLF